MQEDNKSLFYPSHTPIQFECMGLLSGTQPRPQAAQSKGNTILVSYYSFSWLILKNHKTLESLTHLHLPQSLLGLGSASTWWKTTCCGTEARGCVQCQGKDFFFFKQKLNSGPHSFQACPVLLSLFPGPKVRCVDTTFNKWPVLPMQRRGPCMVEQEMRGHARTGLEDNRCQGQSEAPSEDSAAGARAARGPYRRGRRGHRHEHSARLPRRGPEPRRAGSRWRPGGGKGGRAAGLTVACSEGGPQ